MGVRLHHLLPSARARAEGKVEGEWEVGWVKNKVTQLAQPKDARVDVRGCITSTSTSPPCTCHNTSQGEAVWTAPSASLMKNSILDSKFHLSRGVSSEYPISGDAENRLLVGAYHS